MIPARTARSNFVYRGPTPDIGDAWVERVPADRVVYIEWQPSPFELELLAAGGLIRLGIWDPLAAGIESPESALIAFTERPRANLASRGGRHVELGMAIALSKTIVIVGPRENVFCTLPGIVHHDTWPDRAYWRAFEAPA